MQHALVLVLSLISTLCQSCSYVEICVPASPTVIGRTMELASRFNDWEVTAYPANATDTSLPRGYSFVSVDGLLKRDFLPMLRVPTEGINEHGFTISALTLRQSQYQASQSSRPQVYFWEVLGLLLRSARTVREAIAVLEETLVVGAGVVERSIGGLHWAMNDPSGDGVVMEYIQGVLTLHNNTVGVLTNDPPFEWHLHNLNNYVSLQTGWPRQSAAVQVDTSIGMVPETVSHGLNLMGLPGDASPPSRFARMFYLRQFAVSSVMRPTTKEECIAVATGLINNVHLIKGTVARANDVESFEYTPFSVIKIPATRELLFRTYSDMQWQRVRLGDLKLDGATSIVRLKVSQTELGIRDVTASLQPVSLA